jgi:hypothetical protein
VNDENRRDAKFEQKSLDEVLKIPMFKEAYQKVIKKNIPLTSVSEARTAFEDEYGFTIDPDFIKIIEMEDKTMSYNMLITRDSLTSGYFENLVIQIDSLNNTDAFIIKYIPSEILKKIEFHDSFKFIGEKEVNQIVTSGKMIYLPNGCYILQVALCYDVYPGQYALPHEPGTLCNNSSFIFTTNSEQICVDSGGEITTTSVSISNSFASSSPGNSVYSAVVPCRVGCIEEDNLVDDPCEELKKLLQTPTSLPPNGISIKAAIEDLRNRYTMTEHEEGYSFYFNSTNNQMYALPAEQLTNYSVRYRKSPAVFGGAHFHQDGLVPMFSHDDVPTLLNLYNQSQTALNQENPNFPISTHLLVSELGVYAIIPDNPTLFNSTISSIYADEVKRDKFRKKLESMYNRLFSPFNQTWSDDTDDYLKILLKFMTNIDSDNNYSLGLSLYRGKYDANGNINGWEKLTIQKKPNTVNDYEIIKSNCN